MKSTSTCPFFESFGLYWMSYSLSSIAQRAILPDKSGLCIVLRRGRSVSTRWDVPRSRGEVSWLLSGGLRRPAQDGYTVSLHRLRIC